jgi:hypothetical protein
MFILRFSTLKTATRNVLPGDVEDLDRIIEAFKKEGFWLGPSPERKGTGGNKFNSKRASGARNVSMYHSIAAVPKGKRRLGLQ